MKIVISIIVPIYNLELYLPKCIDSILSQTFTNFELILVNDGSTDNSGKICDSYAKSDSRVKVIHKRNGGVASSRNAGLKAAKGTYIGFVDNDDYINKYMFEILYSNAILHSSDIVICDYLSVEEVSFIDQETIKINYKVQHFNNIEALNQIYINDKSTFIYPWNKLYKRTLFNDIQYEDGNLYDDETVAHKLLYRSKRITYIHNSLYYYVNRNDSMVNTPFHIKKLGRVYALKGREEFFRDISEYELHQKALKHYMETFFRYYYMAKSNLSGIEKDLKRLKRTFNKSLLLLLKHDEIGIKQKTMFIIFSLSPAIFEYLTGATSHKDSRKEHSRT